MRSSWTWTRIDIIRQTYLINQIMSILCCLVHHYSDDTNTEILNYVERHLNILSVTAAIPSIRIGAVYSKKRLGEAKHQAKHLTQLWYTPEVGFFFLYYTLHEQRSVLAGFQERSDASTLKQIFYCRTLIIIMAASLCKTSLYSWQVIFCNI